MGFFTKEIIEKGVKKSADLRRNKTYIEIYGAKKAAEIKERQSKTRLSLEKTESNRKRSVAMKGNKNCLGHKPSKETKNKMSLSHKGRKTWNTGLTKETDTRVAEYAMKGTIARKKSGRCIGHSCSHRVGGGKIGVREDIGHFVRSTWEANVARIFMLNGIKYEYEKHRFILEDCSYCPDFYIPEKDVYIEVKGYLTGKAKMVLHKFIKANPNIKLLIIDKDVYNILSEKHKKNIIAWEN